MRFLMIIILINFFSLHLFSQPSPAFNDVTTETGLDGETGYRIVFGDVNGDGYDDIILHAQDIPSKRKLTLFLNKAHPTIPGKRIFVDFTTQSQLTKDASGNNIVSDFAVFGDTDNDGDLDVFLGVGAGATDPREFPNPPQLMINNGFGVFTPAPPSDLNQDTEPYNLSAVFFDYNQDGLIDIYVGNGASTGYRYHTDSLYHNIGNNQFENVTNEAGISGEHRSNGVTAVDWDNDGDQDILVSTYHLEDNILWQNNGDGTFTNVAINTGFAKDNNGSDGGFTNSAEYADFDNDGDFDVFLVQVWHVGWGENADRPELLTNLGAPTYNFARYRNDGIYDVLKAKYEVYTLYGSWLDYNNDMLSDIYLCHTPKGTSPIVGLLFKQNPDHTFDEVSTAENINLNHPHALTVSDFDGDGDEDLLFTMDPWSKTPDGEAVKLYENTQASSHNWLQVKLKGLGAGYTNTAAIGARIKVKTADGTIQMREVSGGKGQFGAQNSLIQHFGLGNNSEPVEIEVRWADVNNTIQTFQNVEVNRRILIIEGDNQTYPYLHLLRVDKTGTGEGTVTSNPAGIDCGADCTEKYSVGTVITLSATPDPGSVFSGWSGDCSGTNQQTTVIMNADKSCIATFSPPNPVAFYYEAVVPPHMPIWWQGQNLREDPRVGDNPYWLSGKFGWDTASADGDIWLSRVGGFPIFEPEDLWYQGVTILDNVEDDDWMRYVDVAEIDAYFGPSQVDLLGWLDLDLKYSDDAWSSSSLPMYLSMDGLLVGQIKIGTFDSRNYVHAEIMNLQTIPEPTTIVLLGSGILIFAGLRKIRRTAK